MVLIDSVGFGALAKVIGKTQVPPIMPLCCPICKTCQWWVVGNCCASNWRGLFLEKKSQEPQRVCESEHWQNNFVMVVGRGESFQQSLSDKPVGRERQYNTFLADQVNSINFGTNILWQFLETVEGSLPPIDNGLSSHEQNFDLQPHSMKTT